MLKSNRAVMYISLSLWLPKAIAVLDFRLSPCSECRILSFGWFAGVLILCADVSEHCLFRLHRWCKQLPAFTTYEVGTDSVFRNVGT